MSPDFVLDLGLIMLGLMATYASWSATRDSCFQLELINIRTEMDLAQGKSGGSADPAYLSLREDLDRLIEYTPYLSITILLLYQRRRRKQSRSAFLSIPIASHAYLVGRDDAPPAVKRGFKRALKALVFHIVPGPAGLGLIAFLAIFRRTGDIFGDLLTLIRSLTFIDPISNPAKMAS